MTNITLLLKLPSAWLIALLSEWLDMPSIGMMDTAMTSKLYRPQFLDFLQVMRSLSIDCFSAERGRGRQLSERSIWTSYWWRWLSIRKIHTESIVLCGGAVRSDLAIPSMREVDARSFGQVDLFRLVRNCPSLRSLNLSSGAARLTDRGLCCLTKLHQTLEEFCFDGGFIFRPEELIAVLRRCTYLRKVSLTDKALHSVNLVELAPYGHLFYELNFGFRTQSIECLLAKCSNLRKFTCEGCDDEEENALILTSIHRFCPLLEDIVLSSFKFIQQVAGADLFTLVGQTCKHLRKLSLEDCDFKPSIFRQIAGIETLKELKLLDFDGLTDAGMALLTTMKLERLTIIGPQLTYLQSFGGTAISHSLEYLYLAIGLCDDLPRLYDVQLATGLASCHKLKTLCVHSGWDGCVFGLTCLQAIASGCPLLAEVELHLTVSGLHCIGTHFTQLKTCKAYRDPDEDSEVAAEAFPSIEELQTLYPAIKWALLWW